MAARTIETRAVISAEDRTGPAFAAVVQHMARMEEAARSASARVKTAAMAEGQQDQHMAARARFQQQILDKERQARREEMEHMNKVERFRRQTGFGGDISGRQMAMGIAGAALAERTAEFMHESLETYREFDKERRYGKAVMAISDDDQEALVRQAIHGGGTSKFNDIQWLEAQRELAARGLNKDQVLAITPVAATLGQAVDKTLPEASRMLEGGMFGFGKDVSTYEQAMANAKRTADLQVKASKISGMTAEDIVALYKYAAGPSRMAGLSEEQMLAFGAVGKRANMPGDEMGTAIRALSAALLKPTAGARTAMLANGINYSSFQKLGTRKMEAEPFAQSIAASYGVVLADKAKVALQKVFDDKAIVQDASKFMPAIMKVLASELGGDDAKSKKSIAGEARRYRDASMSGVDVQGLLTALLPAMAKNPALANMLFGAKQGGRLGLVMGNAGTLLEKLDQLVNHSQGYADDISKQRMAGFDGAVSRFEGAVKNLESALPRAFDNNGKGGFLTNITSLSGKLVQSLAEAPPALQRLAVTAGVAAAAFAGFKGAEALMGGFGLKAAATDLIAAAEALKGSAGLHAAENGLPTAGGKTSGSSKVGKILRGAAIVGTAIETYDLITGWLHDKGYTPSTYDPSRAPFRSMPKPQPGSLTPGGLSSNGPQPALGRGRPQKVDVSIQQPPPLKVEVSASSELLKIIADAKSIQLKAKAGADTGPGGLGETHTGQ